MSGNNLPIKIILPKETDIQKNKNGGGPTFFGEFTVDLQNKVANMFENLINYYDDVFSENDLIPAVGKIIVKQKAIAKSHKPNELCKKCPIIGSGDLNEIYIKINKKSICETINLIKNPTSERIKANITIIENIKPINIQDKISDNLEIITQNNRFNEINKKIKIKVFDFGDDFDNSQIFGYVVKKISELNVVEKQEIITYGEKIKFIKVELNSYDDVIKIASINGVKSIDFFQEYSLPINKFKNINLNNFLDSGYSDSEVRIGIIDGGISDENLLLKPFIVAREEYVNERYRNPSHATFIASTIQYGNKLNNIVCDEQKHYKFVDIIAIPNGDERFGPVDTICEDEFMEIIEEVMNKYSSSTKIWNISLGIEEKVCTGNMSDLGIFFDYIQDKYQVQIFVSSGNLNSLPLRKWPAQETMGERDRIISPADSVRAITSGSLALYDSNNSIVKKDEPSPFSRRGPGANYIVKPDVVDYGGNLSIFNEIDNLGIKGLDIYGNVIEGNGTSYSNPRTVQKYAAIYDSMNEKDILLAKAMLIHSARMNSNEILNREQNNIKYYGFGMPSVNVQDIVQCSDDKVTLIFKQKIFKSTHLEMYDFPYPSSLIRDGKYYGEICMTLVYNPTLNERYGREYCRTNIDVSFGVYKYGPNGKIKYKGEVPLECTWDEMYEQARIEHGFKWSPIKSYYRKISKGIGLGNGWKIRIDMIPRDDYIVEQEIVLIITIIDPDKNDIYSEVVNGLREKGYVVNNFETKFQYRQRQ